VVSANRSVMSQQYTQNDQETDLDAASRFQWLAESLAQTSIISRQPTHYLIHPQGSSAALTAAPLLGGMRLISADSPRPWYSKHCAKDTLYTDSARSLLAYHQIDPGQYFCSRTTFSRHRRQYYLNTLPCYAHGNLVPAGTTRAEVHGGPTSL
jgi:hypothetical protein